MKTLHLVGHNHIWNLDACYKNDIGDGFIFCAYSFKYGSFEKTQINKYPMDDILSRSLIDLQYFGKKESGNIKKGNLDSYPFHPAAQPNIGDETEVYIENAIKRGIEYQIKLGLRNIIIPNYYENNNLDNFLGILKTINKWLSKNKVRNIKYFMTIPITNHTIIDEVKIEKILYCLTDMDIEFDGYYVICEPKPDTMQKISIDFKYLKNLSRVFEVLKKQKFLTIYAYANWDAILFLATTDIDYITIASYENLRNFNIKRFLMTEDGGASKGWYFSEKVLNFIKAPLIDLIRIQKGIEIIRNDRNIFSDILLQPNYLWNNHKPEVHKNYLLSVDRLLKEIASINDLTQRRKFVLAKIEAAQIAYKKLDDRSIYLTYESKNYHLETWENYLRTK